MIMKSKLLLFYLSFIAFFAIATENNYYFEINDVYYGDCYTNYIGSSYYFEIIDPEYPENRWFESSIFHEPSANTVPANLQCASLYNPSNQVTHYRLEGCFSRVQPLGNDIIIEYSEENHEESGGTIINDEIWHSKEYFRIDDWADNSSDNSHICRLLLSDDYTNGFLQPEVLWYLPGFYYGSPPQKTYTLPADIDVFKIDLDPGVYCIETEVNNLNASFGLEINLYNTNTFNNDTKMQFMTDTYDYNNRYDDNGNLDNIGQRLYFKNDEKRICYIEVKQRFSIPELPNIEYKIRVLKARPVILVHGIECWPKEKGDLVAGNNSMGHWNDYLPYDANCYPCFCYNFLWDSKENDLEYDPADVSKIKEIVNCDTNINPSVVKLEESHNMNVVIIGHSMGGYIVRYALSVNNSLTLIHKAITLGDPHYGSDIAFIPNCKLIAWFKRTSEINLMALRRGSKFVWEMHKWGGKSKLVCLAGYDAPPRVPEWLGYAKGLNYSDGVVPVPSAFVIGADNAMKLRADHGTVGIATYVSQDKYPFDPDPPGLLETFRERIFGNNKGQNRISPELIIGDSKYNKVYKKVRSYIKP